MTCGELAFFQSVTSTNEVVKAAIVQGKAAGFTAVALSQTGGYGRQGRTWSSPAGGVYLSVLLRPAVPLSQIPSFSLVAALAVRRALIEALALAPEKLQVKWPNDIVVPAAGHGASAAAFSKLVGISSELVSDALCIGVGVNCLRAAAVETDGRYQPAYAEDLAPEVFAGIAQGSQEFEAFARGFAQRIAASIIDCCERWQQAGFVAFAEEYTSCSFLSGKEVVLVDALDREQRRGMAWGINAQGNLMVEIEPGIFQAVCAGEAHIIG